MIPASTDTPFRARIRHGLIRLVAGGSPWGWLDVWPSRYGFTHVRLVVCAPGTSPAERALLRLWRAGPMLVVLAGGVLLLAAGALGVPPIAAAGAAAIGVAAGALRLAHLTRRGRPNVRVRVGGLEDTGGIPRSVGDMDVIDHCWTALSTADRALRSGAITALQHEVVWSRVWIALGPEHGPSRRWTGPRPSTETPAPRRRP